MRGAAFFARVRKMYRYGQRLPGSECKFGALTPFYQPFLKSQLA